MQEKTYDTNIEATVLSSLIYSPALFDIYASKLSKKLFFLPLHVKIMEVLLDLHSNDKIIDEEILRNKMGSEYENDLIYILTKNPITRLDDYIEILQDYSIKRDMQMLAFDISKGLEDNLSGVELQARINNLTTTLTSSNPLELLEISNIDKIEDKEVEFICKEWLPVPVRITIQAQEDLCSFLQIGQTKRIKQLSLFTTPQKNTTQSRGASAFVDAVRTVYEIDKIKDKEGKVKESNKRVVKFTKDNYGISHLLKSFSVERVLFPVKIVHEETTYNMDNTKFGMPNDF